MVSSETHGVRSSVVHSQSWKAPSSMVRRLGHPLKQRSFRRAEEKANLSMSVKEPQSVRSNVSSGVQEKACVAMVWRLQHPDKNNECTGQQKKDFWPMVRSEVQWDRSTTDRCTKYAKALPAMTVSDV